MHTFAQRPKTAQQDKSAKSTAHGRAHFGQNREVNAILPLQPTIGNTPMQQRLQAKPDGLKAVSNAIASSRFYHDFPHAPVHAKASIKVQPKLAVNTPGDIYEQEADRIADRVMRMPAAQLQRACACGEERPGRQTERQGQEQGFLQTKHIGPSDLGERAAPPIVHEVLRSPGQVLDPADRVFMENRFGHDFSRVRVHSDAKAAESAQGVHARAYTVGRDVVFGRGQFAQHTAAKRRLLAHELVHVVQQGGAAPIDRGKGKEDTALFRRYPKSGISPFGPLVAATISAFSAKDTIQRAMDPACRDCMSERCPSNQCGAVNMAIQLYYKVAGLLSRPITQRPGRYGEFSIPGSGLGGNLGWADLTNASSPTVVQVTEIKPNPPSAADANQVNRYITAGRTHCDPSRTWMPGNDFPPMPHFAVPSGRVGRPTIIRAWQDTGNPGFVVYEEVSRPSLSQTAYRAASLFGKNLLSAYYLSMGYDEAAIADLFGLPRAYPAGGGYSIPGRGANVSGVNTDATVGAEVGPGERMQYELAPELRSAIDAAFPYLEAAVLAELYALAIVGGVVLIALIAEAVAAAALSAAEIALLLGVLRAMAPAALRAIPVGSAGVQTLIRLVRH